MEVNSHIICLKNVSCYNSSVLNRIRCKQSQLIFKHFNRVHEKQNPAIPIWPAGLCYSSGNPHTGGLQSWLLRILECHDPGMFTHFKKQPLQMFNVKKA